MWLIVGGCNKNKSNCQKDSAVTYGVMRFYIKDELGRNYIAAKQLPAGSLVVYDSALNYPTAREGMVSWEQEQKYYFGEFKQIEVDFAKDGEPIGTMLSKTFYVKIDKDMDTLKVEYKIEDECMRMSNFKALYNGSVVYTEVKLAGIPVYDFNVIKK